MGRWRRRGGGGGRFPLQYTQISNFWVYSNISVVNMSATVHREKPISSHLRSGGSSSTREKEDLDHRKELAGYSGYHESATRGLEARTERSEGCIPTRTRVRWRIENLGLFAGSQASKTFPRGISWLPFQNCKNVQTRVGNWKKSQIRKKIDSEMMWVSLTCAKTSCPHYVFKA